ncbi:PEP-CTERM sorting domain-containing protein [Pseudoduganella buxea]
MQVSPVPEPSTWAMLAAGFGLPAVTARPRRKA